MENKEIISSLLEWSSFLSERSLIKDAGRTIAFWICKLCANIIDKIMGGIDSVLNFLNILNEPIFNAFIKRFNPYIWALLLISLIILSIGLMLKKQDKPANLLLTVCLIIFCTSMLPSFSKFITNITLEGAKDVQSAYSSIEKKVTKEKPKVVHDNIYESTESVRENSLGYTILQKNIVDMLKVDQLSTDGKLAKRKNFDFKKTKPFVNAKQVEYFDINEKIDYRNNDSIKNKEIWKNKLRPAENIERTQGITEKLTNMEGHFDITSEYYYRYSVNWILLILVMISIATTLIFSIFRLVRIIYEALAHRVLLPFIAVTDLESGQRTKQALKSFITILASILLVLLFLGIYFLLIYNLGEKYSQGKINTVIYIIMLFAFCMATIDGTKLVERILGVDIGIKSGYHTFMTLLAGIMMGGRVAMAPISGAASFIKGRFQKSAAKRNQEKQQSNGQTSTGSSGESHFNNSNKELLKNNADKNISGNNNKSQPNITNSQTQNKTIGDNDKG